MVAAVLAAGGVLWRPVGGAGPAAIEVAVVHRPRYDDWSLPKGKLEPGEPPLTAALREVHEETGYTAVAGRTLGASSYRVLLDGHEVPKTVRWWAMRVTGGEGWTTDNDEVDRLRWLPPDAAADLLTAARDIAPLRLLVTAGLGTTTVVLVRHGRAGNRADWPGDDLERPLDHRGRRQARALAQLLPGYGPERVVSAPAIRCQQTLAPLAAALGRTLEVEPAFGEQAYGADPDAALDRLHALARATAPVAVCSQGGAIPGLVRAVAARAGLSLDTDRTRKGSAWALTFAAGRLIDADRIPPPP